MSDLISLPIIVKHLANGTLGQKLCRICLLPLDDLYEDIFTRICKENNEYCVADVLEEVCNVKIDKSEEYKVCPKCFNTAAEAYKFYLQTLRSQEILRFYIDKLNIQLSIDIPEHLEMENIFLSLPVIVPQTKIFDYDITDHPFKQLSNINSQENDLNLEHAMKKKIALLDKLKNVHKTFIIKEKKFKRKRSTMAYKMCSRCPIQYRFVGKLKEHMKTAHDVDLFVCRICEAQIEDENEYKTHLLTHSDVHTCVKCDMVFKKRKSLIEHLKWHNQIKLTSQEGTCVCEVCGVILANQEDLREHTDKKHVNKFTCYYCGKRYKMRQSFDLHIKKHEMHLNNGEVKDDKKVKKDKSKQYACGVCGREFVDERALLLHARLHAGVRPFACDVCGRTFVSLNRRNQHALCAHTAPSRRCPLCPALFHLRSMVNTHIKKVHLRTNKRRNRHCKRREVYWKTETVPLQELSVAVQNGILKLKTAQDKGRNCKS